MKLVTCYTLDYTNYQNKDYNGWTGDVYRNKVLLILDPCQKIIAAVVNTPGSYNCTIIQKMVNYKINWYKLNFKAIPNVLFNLLLKQNHHCSEHIR